MSSCYCQSSPKWSVDGNSVTSSDFLGTTNNEDLIFKTNNTTAFKIKANGNIILKSLEGFGNGLITIDNNGKAIHIPFTGDVNQVLLGNGTFGSLSGILWSNGTSGKIYYNGGKVGIGTATPNFKLDVDGDVRITQNLYLQGELVISEKIQTPRQMKAGSIVVDSLLMDSTKAVYGITNFKDDVKLQSKLSVNGDARINGDLYVSNLKLGTSSDNIEITTLSIPGGGKLMGIGTIPKPIPSCTPAYAPGNVQFNRVTINNSINLNAFDFRNEGMTAFIDFGENAISTTDPPTTLKINSFCSSNIDMCAAGGNVIMCTTPEGKVSIGTTTATEKFQVDNGNTLIRGTNNYAVNGNEAILFLGDQNHYIKSINGIGIKIGTFGVTDGIVLQQTTGKVGIGTDNIPTDFMLAVKGKIIAEEVNVKLFLNWPDYVFEEKYEFLTIPELKKFTTKEKHLPNMPSAENVEKNGINLSEMVAKLLRSQEEQSKYIIQLYEQNLQLQKEIELLKK